MVLKGLVDVFCTDELAGSTMFDIIRVNKRAKFNITSPKCDGLHTLIIGVVSDPCGPQPLHHDGN